ncbi:hypothetical protein HMPREF2586_05965 [Staphylococcus sp. HMSC034G07]|uniref:Zn-binding domain-containing protein n=1 Tax=Staphylococcus sp. HMSC034G07 TaxID=1715065 RepID=UPI0008A9D5D5|nr:Zn-binding domain-containing protein [Staphylococcus sp. HMSC034G07]OHO42296.1 hypothetical protein HMPREF2586_05965 [Staphylococcus sp. HMSC034G07]
MARKIEVPRGKLVGMNGPGSLYIDTDGVSYIVGAAEKWYESGLNKELTKFTINDNRLENLLKVKGFREVPIYKKNNDDREVKNSNVTIPISRFPLAHYCSKCHVISEFSESSSSKIKECKICGEKKEHIQFPLVVVCEHGHIYDFPYFKYTHSSSTENSKVTHNIFFKMNGSSILNGSLVCSCGAYHSLKGVTGKSKEGDETPTPFQRELKNEKCKGKRPWGGKDVYDKKCNGRPVAILKNALGVYQPELFSVLSLTNGHKREQLCDYESILVEEFDKLSNDTQNLHDASLNVKLSFNGEPNSIIKKVNSVRRLQELVVQTGFHRLIPSDEEEAFIKATDDTNNKKIMFSSSDVSIDWYPAKELYGEGIFIEFNEDVLNKWGNFNLVQEYMKRKINKITDDDHLKDKFSNPINILIHTLSHGLIKQFSKLSGYSITSISEKLYFYKNRYGILIYVTDSDKDGTFGGLVRLAEEEKFKLSFNEALKSMEWCSSDPVCREIGYNNGQGLYYSNGAACHNCTYLPNTSCSYRNCYLDREFVFILDSKVCIRNHFDWFVDNEYQWKKLEHKLKILKNGEENTYGNWNTLIDLGITTSSYFLNRKYTEPDYFEGIVQIDNDEYKAAYIWIKEKRIVLLDEKYQGKKIPSDFYGLINGWEILKNK